LGKKEISKINRREILKFLKKELKGGMNRCIAIKDDGEQCTRNKSKENKTFCAQHAKGAAKKKITKVGTVEPWTLLKLPVPDPRNGKRFIQKIRTHLNKTQQPNEPGGFIYIFYVPTDSGPDYWKIGYTERPVEERLSEWSKIHKLKLYVSYSIKKGVHQIESLIHLYLAYCRVYRYPSKRGYHSVYKLSKKVIKDGQEHEEDDEERLVAKNKEIEWFCAPIDEILHYVEPIVLKK